MKPKEDVAAYWDRVFGLSGGTPRGDDWLDRHLPRLTAGMEARALDLGCGRGANTPCLARNGYRVVACDVSMAALTAGARGRCAVQRVRLDMRDGLPFASMTFDAVVADLSLHYYTWETTCRIEREIRRVLAREGLLLGRVNSTRDSTYGAGWGIEVEPGYYDIEGHYKRFYNLKQVGDLLREWQILHLAEGTTHKYGRPKQVIEFACLRKGATDAHRLL